MLIDFWMEYIVQKTRGKYEKTSNLDFYIFRDVCKLFREERGEKYWRK